MNAVIPNEMQAVANGEAKPVGASTVFSNAQLVLPTEVVHGSLRVDGGRIHAIDSGTTSITGGIDCEGDYLLPGLVEMHTDNFERHLMPRPKVQWATLPALIAHDAEIAAAGITTVFDALGVGDADPDSLRGSTWRRIGISNGLWKAWKARLSPGWAADACLDGLELAPEPLPCLDSARPDGSPRARWALISGLTLCFPPSSPHAGAAPPATGARLRSPL